MDFMPQAQDYGIVARNQIGPDIYTYADLGKVSRVLINLLDNALKFTPPGGEVCFSAERWKDDRIAVHVSDTGPGIPQEYRVKIFDQFAQVPGTRSRRRGSGLGLTFCRLTIEAHGGKIWVDSQPEAAARSLSPCRWLKSSEKIHAVQGKCRLFHNE